MKLATIVTGPPVVAPIGQMELMPQGIEQMLAWVKDRRPECVPDEAGWEALFPHDLHRNNTSMLSHNELLVELAGRSCYNSFGLKAGKKTNAEYIANTQAGDIPAWLDHVPREDDVFHRWRQPSRQPRVDPALRRCRPRRRRFAVAGVNALRRTLGPVHRAPGDPRRSGREEAAARPEAKLSEKPGEPTERHLIDAREWTGEVPADALVIDLTARCILNVPDAPAAPEQLSTLERAVWALGWHAGYLAAKLPRGPSLPAAEPYADELRADEAEAP